MYKAFLIKYGEIGTKGKNRYIFEDMLVHQIRHALKKVEGTFDVTKENGRIYVEGTSEFDDEDAINALRKVFGILWICPRLRMRASTSSQRMSLTTSEPCTGERR